MSELCCAMTPSVPCGRISDVSETDSLPRAGLPVSCTDISSGMTSDECRRWQCVGEMSDTVNITSQITPPGIRIPLIIRTNALYDILLLPNIGLSVAVTDRFIAGADWMGTWLNDSRHRYYRIYGANVDLSWRIGGADKPTNPFSGHHAGIYASFVYYDIQGGFSHRGYMSDKYNYAVGVSYTYSHPLTRHFDIAFSVGIGYMWGKFMRHRPIDDHDVWLSTHRRSWFGPTRAAVSFVWVFGSAYNERKGGSGR